MRSGCGCRPGSIGARSLVVGLLAVVVTTTAPAAFAAPAPNAVVTDCGIITCTTRADREGTAALQDVDKVTGTASALCGAAGADGVVPGVVCGLAVNGIGAGVAVFAERVYADGDCLGLRLVVPTAVPLPVVPAPPTPVVYPVRVAAGTFNCR
jgi:hypothetical protein